MYPVKYIPKEEMIDEYFGLCSYNKKTIFIRNDIPKYIQIFVLAHERQHEKDYKNGIKGTLWLEIRANVLGGLKHPIGFIGCIILTIFTFKRWKLYIKRIVKGK